MRSLADRVRRRMLGAAFLVVLSAALGASVLTYEKAFTPAVHVTVETTTAGNQLNVGADVKIRGLIVGEVRKVSTTGTGASLSLALSPDSVGLIPANVRARLLPKTLFGEKYVDLVVPPTPSPQALRAGAVIGLDRSQAALELEQVVDDLMPLLRTLEPAQLSATLTAMADALRGRGDRLGANLVAFGDYLARVSPELPTVRVDLQRLAVVATTYADIAPDLLATLSNLTVTNRTVYDQRQQIAAFFGSTTTVARTTTSLLDETGDRIIRVAGVSRPVLELLARYSPEFPCLLRGLAAFEPRLEHAYGGDQPGLRLSLEVVRDHGPYQRGRDEPVYAAHNGPECHGLPYPVMPYPGDQFADGYDYSGSRGPLPAPPGVAMVPLGAVSGSVPVDMGTSGTAGEQQVVGTLLGPAMGRPADQVPSLATLLFGPLARGAAVRLS